jgi:hypothetical protein
MHNCRKGCQSYVFDFPHATQRDTPAVERVALAAAQLPARQKRCGPMAQRRFAPPGQAAQAQQHPTLHCGCALLDWLEETEPMHGNPKLAALTSPLSLSAIITSGLIASASFLSH